MEELAPEDGICMQNTWNSIYFYEENIALNIAQA